MGFRTVVILANDQAHEWQKDAELGNKIFHGSYAFNGQFPYGRVIECCHADQQTLGVIDSYRFLPMSYGQWNGNETSQDMQIRLLKDAARKLGYKLVKTPHKRG